MFKSFINIIVLFILLLGNMALFTWCVNHLEWNKDYVEKTLISNVQAEGAAPPQVLVMSSIARDNKVGASKSFLNHSTLLSNTSLPPASRSNSRLAIRFKGSEIRVDEAERARLTSVLQRLEIGTSHAVELLAADAVVSDNKSLSSSQIAKLRAQNVARIIYPHTQTVKILYRPNLEEGTVVVEFFQARVK